MKFKNFIKREDGVAELIEAAIIYPVVFLFLVFVIYVGLYIMQSMTVASYAEKIANLAAREVAYPGYVDLVSNSVYNTAAVEADFADGSGAEGASSPFAGKVTLNVDPQKVEVKAYRYWSSDPLGDNDGNTKKQFRNILTDLVKKNSILGGGEVIATIDCENIVITQFINVSVEQKLMNFAVLEFFGVESPTIKSTVKSSVNDTDELVRNVDFATDALKMLAEKLGINVDEFKKAVQSARETLGL